MILKVCPESVVAHVWTIDGACVSQIYNTPIASKLKAPPHAATNSDELEVYPIICSKLRNMTFRSQPSSGKFGSTVSGILGGMCAITQHDDPIIVLDRTGEGFGINRPRWLNPTAIRFLDVVNIANGNRHAFHGILTTRAWEKSGSCGKRLN